MVMSGLVFYCRNIKQHPALPVLQSAIQLNGEHRLSSDWNAFLIDAYVLVDSPRSRVIAIDFDNTITADLDFYLDLIDAYRTHGWQPVVCTLRDDRADNLAEMYQKLHDAHIKLYTTNGRKKRAFLRNQGIRVGLWIDDYFPSISELGSRFLLDNGIDF